MTPISEARSQASRANGGKSRGPVTSQGKTRASHNATRHGLSSRRMLIPGESEEDLNDLRVHWMRQLQPLTPAERDAVEHVVAADWRIHRCRAVEASLIHGEIEKAAADPSADPAALGAAFKGLTEGSRAFDVLLRYTNSALRDFDRALRRYHEIVAARRDQQRDDDYDRTEEDYTEKWGVAPREYPVHYCGQLMDVLRNEPEPTPVFHAALHPRRPAAA